VLWPERNGELRSVLLEAMAMGLPVIAAADPALDMLVDGQTASLVASLTPDAWAQAIAALLDSPQRAQALGSGGRQRIIDSHQSSAQVRHLTALLERLVGSDNYAFPAAGQ
jgi:glycosyltransferase involved in cell wall biosynthesis